MTECTNFDVQDLLPEYVADTLSARERVEVEVHLSACAACCADVDVLQAVQRARPVVAEPDVAAIVAALPAPPRASEESRPPADARPFRVITGDLAVPSMQAAAPRRRTVSAAGQRSWFTGTGMRAAAALTLLALGGLSVAIARNGQRAIIEADAQGVAVLSDSPMVLADAPMPYGPEDEPIIPVVALAPSVLPVQELPDYTDEELALLLDQLDAWDGAPSVDVIDPTSPPSNDSILQEGLR